MSRNPISVPIRGDKFASGGRLYTVDELRLEGIVLEIDGGADRATVPWTSWTQYSIAFIVTERATDPCPNAGRDGEGHIGKRILDKNLGRCWNRYRCLACGRTYEVDSSD